MHKNEQYRFNAVHDSDIAGQACAVLKLISEYGADDGQHHKQWLLDQVVRKLLVTDKNYEVWVEHFFTEESEACPGDRFEHWDTGIAP